LQHSSRPYEPDFSQGVSREDKHALSEAFKEVQTEELDWSRIRNEAEVIALQQEDRDVARREAQQETRHFCMMGKVATAWLKQWETAWSSRNLEHLICFFTENCVYQLENIGEPIHGKSELRRLFSDLLHSMNLTMRVEKALTDGTDEVVLKWVRFVPRDLERAPNTGTQFLVHGQSVLKIEYGQDRLKVQDSISKCIETWDTQDVMQRQTTGILRTETEIIFPSGLHIPRHPPR
jgi:hypothetical protein